MVPGSAFGPSGEGHVRDVLATSYEGLEEALRRIGRFVAATAGASRRGAPRRRASSIAQIASGRR